LALFGLYYKDSDVRKYLRPQWQSDDDIHGIIKVIITGSSSDPASWQQHIRNKARRKAIGDRMRDPNDELKLVIVRDMWLTGFDAPSLHTMYIDKPMRGHNLMQAIARVNRVFKDKAGGLLVEYLGIAQDLKKALSDYTASGGEGKPAFDQEEAVAVMLEYYETAVQMFGNFPYKKFYNLPSAEEKLKFLRVAADYILSLEKDSERYTQNVQKLLKTFALSVPHEKALEIRDDVAFFQSVNARIVKVTRGPGDDHDEQLETSIRQLISKAITSDDVIDVFDAAGIKKPNIEIFDDRFLA
jgi:type I restriction enzyme R subunit